LVFPLSNQLNCGLRFKNQSTSWQKKLPQRLWNQYFHYTMKKSQNHTQSARNNVFFNANCRDGRQSLPVQKSAMCIIDAQQLLLKINGFSWTWAGNVAMCAAFISYVSFKR
jgi:hypothetical protein